MSEGIANLWPEEIDTIATTQILSPVAIMRYQAGQLREKTKNLLEAEVVTESDPEYTRQHFIIIAPALDRYKHTVFEAWHYSEMVYPVTVKAACFDEDDWPQASTQEAFMKIVGEVLSSAEVKAVIYSLVARSNEQPSDGKS